MKKVMYEIMKNAEWATRHYVEWMLEREPTEKELAEAIACAGIWERDEGLQEIQQWVDSTMELVKKGTSPEFFKERDWCIIVNGQYLGLDYGMWEYLTFRAK